jgi:hypothetical protein
VCFFEQLVATARTYFQSTTTISSSSSTSPRVFYYANVEEKFCTHCFAESGRKLKHASADCRNNKRQDAGSNKRSAPDDKDVTCYRCNEKGHYSTNCPNPPAAAGGRGGRNQRGRGRGRGGRGGSYYLWVPDEGESGNSPHTEAVAAPVSIAPAPPPPGYVQPPKSSYFSGVLQGHLILLCHRRPNRWIWIYDTGCTSHSSYLREMFRSLLPHDEPMYAANGAFFIPTFPMRRGVEMSLSRMNVVMRDV